MSVLQSPSPSGSVGFIIFVSVEMKCRFPKYSGSLQRGVWIHRSDLSDK